MDKDKLMYSIKINNLMTPHPTLMRLDIFKLFSLLSTISEQYCELRYETIKIKTVFARITSFPTEVCNS